MAVVASLVIDFANSQESSYLSASINSDDNQGKSSFSAGDSVYFRVYAESTYNCYPSSGIVNKVQSGIIESGLNSLLIFTDSEVTESSLSGLVYSIDSWTWFGLDYGSVVQSGVSKAIITGNNGVFPDQQHPGICRVNYSTIYDLWQLHPPNDMPTEFEIVIVILGESL